MDDGKSSKLYHKIKNRFFYIGLVLDVAVLVSLQISGLSVLLRNLSSSFSSNLIVINAAYIAVFCLGMYIIHLPITFFLGFVWEHKFGLSNLKIKAWIIDEFKKGALSFILVLFMVEIIYFLLYSFPDNWWISAGFVWLFLSLFLARIMPNVIIPIFYKYSQINNDDLKNEILDLFKQCRVDVENVYTIDLSSKTKKANAFICGLGKKRRVVLGDTLIENFSNEEIKAVVAHELGHYKNRDIIKLISVNTFVTFLSFYIIHSFLKYVLAHLGGLIISDIATLPIFVLAMMAFGLVTTPLLNFFSRVLERKADEFSLRLTKKPDEFVSMMQKLGEMNLAEMEPSWFNEMMFYDHPPILKRIRFAQEYRV